MAVEHSCVKSLQSVAWGATTISCQGRVLSPAEMVGLPDDQLARLPAVPILLASWSVLLLVATVPLASLAVLFAAPLLLGLYHSRSNR